MVVNYIKHPLIANVFVDFINWFKKPFIGTNMNHFEFICLCFLFLSIVLLILKIFVFNNNPRRKKFANYRRKY